MIKKKQRKEKLKKVHKPKTKSISTVNSGVLRAGGIAKWALR